MNLYCKYGHLNDIFNQSQLSPLMIPFNDGYAMLAIMTR